MSVTAPVFQASGCVVAAILVVQACTKPQTEMKHAVHAFKASTSTQQQLLVHTVRGFENMLAAKSLQQLPAAVPLIPAALSRRPASHDTAPQLQTAVWTPEVPPAR